MLNVVYAESRGAIINYDRKKFLELWSPGKNEKKILIGQNFRIEVKNNFQSFFLYLFNFKGCTVFLFPGIWTIKLFIGVLNYAL